MGGSCILSNDADLIAEMLLRNKSPSGLISQNWIQLNLYHVHEYVRLSLQGIKKEEHLYTAFAPSKSLWLADSSNRPISPIGIDSPLHDTIAVFAIGPPAFAIGTSIFFPDMRW